MNTDLYKFIEDIHAATILIVSQSKSNISIIKKLLNRNGFTDIYITEDPFSVADYYNNE